MKLKEALITCVVCSVCLTPLLVNGETKIDADHCKESIVNIDTIVKSGKSFNSKYNQGMEDYKNSDEYKLKVQKEKLQNQLGIKIKKLVPITFEVSYYTSLNQENGYGAITATGDDLEDGFVANNHLSFGTKIIVDGKLKTVMDRGLVSILVILMQQMYLCPNGVMKVNQSTMIESIIWEDITKKATLLLKNDVL